MNNDIDNHVSVTHPIFKILTAWGFSLFTSWADVASFLAAVYTLCLLLEWWWRKFIRPFAESRGWVKRKYSRRTDRER